MPQSMHSRPSSSTSVLQDYLLVLRRRKLLFLQSVLLVPVVAVLFSLQQSSLYEATSSVILNPQTSASGIGFQDPRLFLDQDRLLATEADRARVPQVLERAVRASGVRGRTAGDLNASSAVTSEEGSDVLRFAVTDRDPANATRLASAYAREFTRYRRDTQRTEAANAGRIVQEQIDELERQDQEDLPIYDTLVGQRQQFAALEALSATNLDDVREAGLAVQVQPRPVRNGLLGLAFGLILGLGLAFLFEALDTRVWSVQEIGNRLGLPLLSRVPAPPGKLRRNNGLVMFAEPHSPRAEAFRVLRTNLDFANIDRGAHTIMITSAVMGEGKSTTLANLAVAFAREGRRVTLVDLDLRQPSLHTFFDIPQQPGLTDVALGRVSLDEAIVRIPLSSEPAGGGPVNGNASGSYQALLEVLPAGRTPPDPGEFVASRAMTKLLDDLRRRADLVLIDTPPLLQVGDAIALSAKVDGLVLVTRLNIVRRPMLNEVGRALETSRAAKLGFIATGAESEETYGSYYYASRQPQPESEPETPSRR